MNDVNQIIYLLKNNQPVILPTDTVYGIFCLKNDFAAKNMIYKIKHRNLFKPLCIYSKNVPLNNVPLNNVPLNNVSLNIEEYSGLTLIHQNIGYRYYKIHPIIEDVINIVGDLYGTSANISGKLPVVNYEYLDSSLLEKIYCYKGICPLGLESTIINIENNEIIRHGYAQKTNNLTFKLNNVYNLDQNFTLVDKKIPWSLDNQVNIVNFWNYIHKLIKDNDYYINFPINIDDYYGYLIKNYIQCLINSV